MDVVGGERGGLVEGVHRAPLLAQHHALHARVYPVLGLHAQHAQREYSTSYAVVGLLGPASMHGGVYTQSLGCRYGTLSTNHHAVHHMVLYIFRDVHPVLGLHAQHTQRRDSTSCDQQAGPCSSPMTPPPHCCNQGKGVHKGAVMLQAFTLLSLVLLATRCHIRDSRALKGAVALHGRQSVGHAW